AFKGGWDSVKLYFMIGLPYETWDDLEHIAELVQMVKRVYRDVQGSREPAAKARSLKISVSASSFVPKPFTPFQWEPQDSVDDLKKKQDYLAGKLRIRGVDFSWHDPRLSFLEAVISRGDRKVGRAIVKAWEKGCRFDGWGEHFKYELWMQAFEECEVDPRFYANRKRNPREVFPWSHISAGVTESYLLMEKQKAERSEVTPDCRSACNGCGAAVFKGGICLERDKD
ncbi:MAG: B12-binding domain-containing radical SAM protein, partial [Eubacteriales bacterium]|nr:B12-binding domain-containing radical SAM protein [Eubacteriales bacterium]